MDDDKVPQARERVRFLRREVNRLAAEADEIEAALDQIAEGQRKLAARLPRTRPPRDSVGGHGRPTKTELIRSAVEEVLREAGGGPVRTAKLLRLIERKGIEVGGKTPVGNLSAKLSHAKKGRFELVSRKEGWALPSSARPREVVPRQKSGPGDSLSETER